MSELERMLQNAFAVGKLSNDSPAKLARYWKDKIRRAAENDSNKWVIIRYHNNRFDRVWKAALGRDQAERAADELNEEGSPYFYCAKPCE